MEKVNDKWSAEMIISPEKIWHNGKRLWWLALLILGPILAYILYSGYRNYQADVAGFMADRYQASSVVYIDSKDEDYTDSYKWILASNDLREDINEALLAAGMEEFDENKDLFVITRMGESMYYELLVRCYGQERTQLVAQQYTDLLIEYAKDIMKLKGRVINEPELVHYVEKYNGAFVTYDLDEEFVVRPTVSDFITWNKLMILCAGVFLWVAVVMVRVFMDKVFRTGREADVATGLTCVCTVDKKHGGAADFLAVMFAGAAGHTGGKHFVLASAGPLEEAASLAEEVQKKLAGENSYGKDIVAEAAQNIGSDASSLEKCRQADQAFLVIKLNQDRVTEVEQAMKNLEITGIKVPGYILVK